MEFDFLGHQMVAHVRVYMPPKWAVEDFSKELQYGVEPFKLRVKIIEPGSQSWISIGIPRSFLNQPQTIDDDAYVAGVFPLAGHRWLEAAAISTARPTFLALRCLMRCSCV